MSSRQFRMAFKTLARLTAPPAPITTLQPLLLSTLMELVHSRLHSPAHSFPPRQSFPKKTIQSPEIRSSPSEQATYILAMIDAFPFLPEREIEHWMSVTAASLSAVPGEYHKTMCQARFWEMISSGELNPDHAVIAINWWTTKRGREVVMNGVTKDAHSAV